MQAGARGKEDTDTRESCWAAGNMNTVTVSPYSCVQRIELLWILFSLHQPQQMPDADEEEEEEANEVDECG